MVQMTAISHLDFQIDYLTIPPTQVDILFNRTKSPTMDWGKYDPNKQDFIWLELGNGQLCHLRTTIGEAIWGSLDVLIQYVLMASAAQISSKKYEFIILEEALLEISMPHPFPFNLKQYDDNSLLHFALLDETCNRILSIQQKITNLQAWIAMAKKQSKKKG